MSSSSWRRRFGEVQWMSLVSFYQRTEILWSQTSKADLKQSQVPVIEVILLACSITVEKWTVFFMISMSCKRENQYSIRGYILLLFYCYNQNKAIGPNKCSTNVYINPPLTKKEQISFIKIYWWQAAAVTSGYVHCYEQQTCDISNPLSGDDLLDHADIKKFNIFSSYWVKII